MDNFILTTERLKLRRMTHDDVGNLSEIFSDPIAMKYYLSTKNEDETLAWIDWTLESYANDGIGLWIVEDKLTGEFLGQCGIVPQDINGTMEMEIGYLFARRAWGNGFATEAAKACKKYGFDQLKRSKLISIIDPRNCPSIKVAERIGMTMEKQTQKFHKVILVYSVYRH